MPPNSIGPSSPSGVPPAVNSLLPQPTRTQAEVDRSGAAAEVTAPPKEEGFDPMNTTGANKIKEVVKQTNAPGGGGSLGGIFSFITSVLMPILAPVFSFITPLATFVQSTLSPIVTAIDTTKNLFRGGSQQEANGGGGAAPADPSAANAARTAENLKAFSERNGVRSSDAKRKVDALQGLLGAVPQIPTSDSGEQPTSPRQPATSSIA
jgi:hypothetical protein